MLQARLESQRLVRSIFFVGCRRYARHATPPNPRTFPTSSLSPKSPSSTTGSDKSTASIKPVPGTLANVVSTIPDATPSSSSTDDSSLLVSTNFGESYSSRDEETSEWAFPAHVPKTLPQPGALRPHLGIKVNPKHGLWHFFRLLRFDEHPGTGDSEASRQQLDDDSPKSGVWRREAYEDTDLLRDRSSRSWSTVELRRKSFADLHTLWYIVLRERNLLATQLQEANRTELSMQYKLLMIKRRLLCRKTHARIKQILSERRRGYERAIESLPEGLAKWRKNRWGTQDEKELLPSPNIDKKELEEIGPS